MSFLPGIFGNKNQQQSNQGNQNQQPQQPQRPGTQQSGNGNGSGGPAAGQGQPANSNFQQNGNGNGNGQGGQGGQGQGGNQEPQNPMDSFMNLLRPSEDVQKRQQQQQEAQSKGLFGDAFTPEAINKAVGSTNFAGAADPEKVKLALSGDAQAFSEVLNAAVANGVSTALQASQGMVEHGVRTGNERFSGSLDSRIRGFQLNNHTSSHKALQHPLGKSFMKMLSQQIATAQPNMPVEAVTAKAEEFFSEFAKMMVPQEEASGSQGSKTSGPDWSSFLDDPSQAQ